MSGKVTRRNIHDDDRKRDVSMLQALIAKLYDDKTSSDDVFGETCVRLKWSGGVLSLVTVEDAATHRPPSYRRHSDLHDHPPDA